MCDGEIEPDLWEALLTAGALWRAARVTGDNPYWVDQADLWHQEATVLLEHDAAGWRWTVASEAGQCPRRSSH